MSTDTSRNPALLTITGEIISIGDLPAEYAPEIIGVPHLMIHFGDRKVFLSGLTREECRACVPGFLDEVSLSIELGGAS